MNIVSSCFSKLRSAPVLTGIAAILLAATATSFSSRTSADGGTILIPVPHPILTTNELLGEAPPDECFNGIGVDYPPINPDGTCDVGQPKTNESYIWGLTEAGGNLYYGTVANAACLTTGQGLPPGDQIDTDRELVCEHGESQIARNHPAIPDGIGDWRVPSIYQYNLATNQLTKRDDLNDQLLTKTLGFRGAGSIDNISFLGGKDLAGHAANIFAFESDTGRYLGSCALTSHIAIRQWLVADGVMYVAVGTGTAGQVLRWNGNAQSFPGDFCADFAEVGHIDANAGYLAVYTDSAGQHRLATTTDQSATYIGLWISPQLGPDGLQPEDADGWVKVWDPSTYEPDHIVGLRGYLGGAVESFGGWLYWGTLQPPPALVQRIHKNCTHDFCFGMPANPDEETALEKGTFRAATVWRGRNLESPTTKEIQLLYGETELPACHTPHSFEMTPTGWTPLYGSSGFGNSRNQYIWQMEIFDNRLFVGTYDSSPVGVPEFGADLWRFDDANSAAVNENFRGLGDINNYGIRAMQGLSDGSGLVVGMANPSNLAVGGGWELRRLKEATP